MHLQYRHSYVITNLHRRHYTFATFNRSFGLLNLSFICTFYVELNDLLTWFNLSLGWFSWFRSCFNWWVWFTGSWYWFAWCRSYFTKCYCCFTRYWVISLGSGGSSLVGCVASGASSILSGNEPYYFPIPDREEFSYEVNTLFQSETFIYDNFYSFTSINQNPHSYNSNIR